MAILKWYHPIIRNRQQPQLLKILRQLLKKVKQKCHAQLESLLFRNPETEGAAGERTVWNGCRQEDGGAR
ncbi:hypothetical protein E2562_005578 [Oryza meyeriana var. granulata]|uniref:Uncharacterized protein n=1 Tax=Oryza meyeriana var. granulata TaxID=110450 RepID=A0A6G1F409_9ORYZ|nr:hypothetical protein E2562_005578 [Oryza meyeriana var. granulata]